MKTPDYYSFSLLLFLFFSPVSYAETSGLLISSIYFIELLLMGGGVLALLLVSLLLFNERNRRAKKIALFHEELDQKMGVMQMMMNSVREKEQSIIKIVQEQHNNIVALPAHAHHNVELNSTDTKKTNDVAYDHDEVFVDPRTLDVNGKLKQPHLGRSNYLLTMKEAHVKGLDHLASIDDFLQAAIAEAVDMSDNNIQEVDTFYQRLSDTIQTLTIDNKAANNKPSSQKMLDALITIQSDFEALMKHQKYNKSAYQQVSERLVEMSYHPPEEVIPIALEK